MRHLDLFLGIYYLLTVLLTLLPQQVHALRCKCNTDRGPAPCIGDFCDIHNRGEKRAACGALRRSRQTIFACVLIRRSSNDTYCHVVGSTTACWCRQIDFCNADLEAELFDVDEPVSDSEADSGEQQSGPISGPDAEQFIIEATLQQIPVEPQITKLSSVKQPIITSATDPTTTTITSTTTAKIPTSTKRSVKTKINPAIRMDVAEKVMLTPLQKEQPPTVLAETFFDSYDDELDDDDEGFQWQAISIPDNAVSTINMPSGQMRPTNSQKLENESRTVEVRITKLSSDTVPTTRMTETVAVTRMLKTMSIAQDTSTTAIKANPEVQPISDHLPDPNSGSVEESRSVETDTEGLWSELIRKSSPLRPVVSHASGSVISSNAATTTTSTTITAKGNGFTERQPATVSEILQQQQIPETQANYARLKVNGTSPTFIYSHSVPKTLLDRWKQNEEEEQQQQQQGDLDWRSDDSPSSNDDATGNSSGGSSSSKLSSALFTSSYKNSLLLKVLLTTIGTVIVNRFCTLHTF